MVTSPPYWGLRDYGTATWEGGYKNCDHRIDRANRKVTKKTNINQNKQNSVSGEFISVLQIKRAVVPELPAFKVKFFL